jgi:hypothetical protein
MKLFNTHKTNIVYQDYGSNLLVIVEGTETKNVDQTLWSFMNHGALEFDSNVDRLHAGTKEVATFWTTTESRLPYSDKEYPNHATRQGKADLAVFLEKHREARRMAFGGIGHVYSQGTISAERPDDCGRDSWVSRGLQG